MKAKSLVAALLVAGLATASGLTAQDRSDLLDQARAEVVGSPAAFELLLSLTDPAAGPLDSLWAVGVYDLADNLINVGESELADVWLRWAVRHGSQWPIDRTWYSPVVVGAYDVALAAVQAAADAGEEAAGTTWGWPGSFDAAAAGTLGVTSQDPGVTIAVQGQGPMLSGQSLTLAPGSYQMTVSAPGFDQVLVTREVLPGVSTAIDIALPPQLPASVQSGIVSSLALISYTQGGQLVCSNGFVVDPRGLVLTTLSSLQNATGIEVATAGGTFGNVVIEEDAGNDLAVLRFQGQGVGLVPPTAPSAADGQYAWAAYRPGCADPTQARTRLTNWQTQSVVALSPAVPEAARGAPLIDVSGSLLGVVTGPGAVLPAQQTEGVIADARAALAGQIAQAGGGEGGGVPSWVFIAGGVGAAGAAAAVLLGGGGPPAPETGSITIFFPGGP